MNRIKELRKSKNLTQTELAKKIGVVPSSISQYESGTRTMSQQVQIAMSDFFGVSSDYLLGRTDNPSISFSENNEESVTYSFENAEKDQNNKFDLSVHETNLIKMYRCLPTQRQDIIYGIFIGELNSAGIDTSPYLMLS